MSNTQKGGNNMDKICIFLEMVERLRHEMNEIASQKSISDPEVLTISKKLDEILNEYQKLLRKKKK